MSIWFRAVLLLGLLTLQNAFAASHFQIGAGISDITGPAAQVGMMGYAELSQKTAGLRMRLYSRAFIIHDKTNNKRIVFVSADLGQLFPSIKQGVIQKLKSLGYGKKYKDQNVMISAIHNHSGPGGYAFHALFNITTLGFNKDNYHMIVDGITQSIIDADQHLADGSIRYNQGKLYRVSLNRSPKALYKNSSAQRATLHGDETDKTMRLIRFDNHNGQPIGLINWFGVHGVSMSKFNKLITGDNKGYASYLFEESMNNVVNKRFIAAFAQGVEGDVSPNIFGYQNGAKDALRLEMIGAKQFQKAKDLYDTATQAITGPVDYRLQYINMSHYVIKPEFGEGLERNTCPSAVGTVFTKGTSDGKGVTINDELLSTLGSLLSSPSKKDFECQSPKNIFLQTANMKPYPWMPNIVPVQLFKIGHIVIAGVPGEFTTVSGELLRKTLLKSFGGQVDTVIIAGLSNSYTGYITTHKEYETQAYEGGFTVYGPWTLNAYLQAYSRLAKDIKNNRATPLGKRPQDLSRVKQIDLQTGVVFDNVPLGKHFGEVIKGQQVKSSYKVGQTVQVAFWGGHPKNNFHTKASARNQSFIFIQQLKNSEWVTILDDHDWNTSYSWQRFGLDASKIMVQWHISKNQTPGKYRIVHQGYYKNGWTGHIKPYVGISNEFKVK